MSLQKIPQEVYDTVQQRKTAYQQVFNDSVAMKAVFEDLKKFCRVEESTFHPDARIHAALEGRREVMLRIYEHLTLSVEDLVRKTLERKKQNV